MAKRCMEGPAKTPLWQRTRSTCAAPTSAWWPTTEMTTWSGRLILRSTRSPPSTLPAWRSPWPSWPSSSILYPGKVCFVLLSRVPHCRGSSSRLPSYTYVFEDLLGNCLTDRPGNWIFFIYIYISPFIIHYLFFLQPWCRDIGRSSFIKKNVVSFSQKYLYLFEPPKGVTISYL